jgi:ABC-type arginine transport system ATPase subunit
MTSGNTRDFSMNKTELVIQLLKIAIGIAFAAYFLWWSLAVLERLPAH